MQISCLSNGGLPATLYMENGYSLTVSYNDARQVTCLTNSLGGQVQNEPLRIRI